MMMMMMMFKLKFKQLFDRLSLVTDIYSSLVWSDSHHLFSVIEYNGYMTLRCLIAQMDEVDVS